MTQEQYIMIKKVLFSGCPACANELCNALDNLIATAQSMKKELDGLKQTGEEKVKEEK